MFDQIRRFIRDESGVSGVVVAMALIVIGALAAYYLWSGIAPGVQHSAGSIGGVLQQQ